jgi:hypothetical protein
MTSRVILLVAVLGCGGPNTSTKTSEPMVPTPTEPASPTQNDGTFTADGRHFAAERVYEGNCAPAGSRGGCYRLTLRPDGSMEYFMLDAAVTGTYEIAGDTLTFTPTDGQAQQLAISADRTMVGELKLKTP